MLADAAVGLRTQITANIRISVVASAKPSFRASPAGQADSPSG
jgi:hypothetical protein